MPSQVFSVDYIVRIYRFGKKNPRHLVGVVEEVGIKGKKAFTNYDELWDILNSRKGIKPSSFAIRERGSLPRTPRGAGGEGEKGSTGKGQQKKKG